MTRIYSDRYQLLLQRLVEARNKNSFTQEEVAKRLNKPQSFISKIESGERKIDFTEVEDLSRIYKVPLSFFKTEEIKNK